MYYIIVIYINYIQYDVLTKHDNATHRLTNAHVNVILSS